LFSFIEKIITLHFLQQAGRLEKIQQAGDHKMQGLNFNLQQFPTVQQANQGKETGPLGGLFARTL
jgi:hypothetical protein